MAYTGNLRSLRQLLGEIVMFEGFGWDSRNGAGGGFSFRLHSLMSTPQNMSATPQRKSFHLQHSIHAIMTPQLMLNAISPVKEFATNLMCTKKHNSYSSEKKEKHISYVTNK